MLRGSAEEVPMLEEIRVAARLARVAVVGTDLRQLFALCEAAHSMISVDTGPAHAAAALSVPLVVLYGAEIAELVAAAQSLRLAGRERRRSAGLRARRPDVG